jgi:TRAP-type C4-dicarboxylate transport system substrate-binding protein
MTKKALLSLMVLVIGAAIFGVTASKTQAATIQLTYSNFFPPTHFNAQLAESWGKEIEKRTKGAVKFTFFPGGALLKGPEMYDGVMKGVSDLGMSVFGYTTGRFPVMEAIDLPIGYTSGWTATMTVNAYYNKFKPKELDDVKVLYLHAHGPGLLHSKTEVSKLEQLRGMKIRCTGFSAKAAAALGAVPVAMGQGQAYEALQKGVVEGTLSPMEVLKGWKQAEVIKSTTLCYSIGYTSGMYVIMNKKKWDALSKDVQKVFEEVSKEWISKTGEGWDKADLEGKEFTLSLGNKIIPLSEAESKLWAFQVEPVIADYAKTLESKGMPGNEYIQFIRESIKKYAKK